MSQNIQKPLKRVLLMARVEKPSICETLNQIAKEVRELGLTALIDRETAEVLNQCGGDLEVVEQNDIDKSVDLVIVIGGDGSILHAGRALVDTEVPVIGVNRGRLGFLADVMPDEVLSKLSDVLKGNFQIDSRFLLELSIFDGAGKLTHQDIALNDVVLHAGKSVHMVNFDMSIDDRHVYRQHSDGLILATPTGSTAYALSGGGPIIHPGLDAFVAVPMHPHTLSSRPIVVSGSSRIVLEPCDNNRVLPMLSADGQSSVPVEPGSSVVIRKHPRRLKLLHPPGYDFYAACRTKLGWNVNLDQDN